MLAVATTHRPCRPYPGLLGALLSVLVILGGCAGSPSASAPATRTDSPTSTSAPTATPTPQLFSAFTCAAGSLPIGSGFTQIQCTVATEGPYSLLRASYRGQGTNGPIDDPRLTADGWLMVDQSHGDSPYGAIGQALYFDGSAWYAVEYSYPTSTMAVEQGVPLSGAASVPCGQTLTASTSQIQGVPLPTGMVTTKAGAYTFVPACLPNVLQFYTSAVSAAGWTLVQPFQVPPGSVSGTPVTTMMATVSRGSTTMGIWLAGGNGTSTMISVHSTPP